MEKFYKRNFIKQVIARVDFTPPLLDLNSDTLTPIVAEIRKRFPIAEQATGFRQGVEIDGKKSQITSSTAGFAEWVFHGAEREKSIRVNPYFLSVQLTQYQSQSSYQNDLVEPISKMIKIRPTTVVAKTSVRFVNVFDFGIDSFQKAPEYFSESISAIFPTIHTPDHCVRTLVTHEFLYDDIKLRLQAGFFNPDYPAMIKRKHFLLDLDASVDFPHQLNEVAEYLQKLHATVEKAFEESITDKLRNEVLNADTTQS